jgi:hypothetical protein
MDYDGNLSDSLNLDNLSISNEVIESDSEFEDDMDDSVIDDDDESTVSKSELDFLNENTDSFLNTKTISEDDIILNIWKKKIKYLKDNKEQFEINAELNKNIDDINLDSIDINDIYFLQDNKHLTSLFEKVDSIHERLYKYVDSDSDENPFIENDSDDENMSVI